MGKTHTFPEIPGYTFETCEMNDGHNHCITGGVKEESWYCVLCRAKWNDIIADSDRRHRDKKL